MNSSGFWYLVVVVTSMVLAIAGKYLLNLDSVLYHSLEETYTYEQINEMIVQSNKWEWIGYCFIPVICVIKSSFVALCLGLGILVITDRFDFGKMFRVAIKAEAIFLIPVIVKLIWFIFVRTDFDLKELQYFYPLSLLNIFDYTSTEPWLLYPLQVINLFEMVYWVLLAYLITRELPEFDIHRSFTIVMSSYGVGLVTWVALVAFLTLTYTPS